ncbi:2-(R)-hydroxypropyl-CoM dehydrogenase [Neofusicoccum parvum]|uniref:2-(R)-hydroxypropyl-CoM dehydrogenase n=1 Tax=Neofusicoccum parvum TaxID=310453 RepID=A0ACB5SLP1_9PEZI|nr:2-(R)-hydroxypropyl-CoM dehydrogenase [Neofusicoccum parvum]
MYLRPSTSRALRAALRLTTPPPAARRFTTTIPRTTSQKPTSERQRARSFPEQAADTRASAMLPPSTAPAYPASASLGQHGHVPRLHGKVALITGASSGLGRAVALAYASHGARLVVCADLRPDPLGDGVEEGEEAALATHELINRKFGTGRAAFARCDVGVAAEVREAVEMAAREGGGRLDIIVNNAGLGTKNRLSQGQFG